MDARYDCLVVGGGPAGLSAALHLAWHRRRVLVLDRRSGPLFYTLTPLENVPGMPGASGVAVQKALRRQAEAMGAEVRRADVVDASGALGDFALSTDRGETVRGRTVLLATGVARHHPTVDGDWRPCLAYAGKCNVYYCPDCEAPETEGRRTLVIGAGRAAGAVGTARHLRGHTSDLRLLLTGEDEPTGRHRAWLDEHGVPVVRGRIRALEGERGCLAAVVLEDGTRLDSDAFFVSSPAVPRTDLAARLGVPLAESGHARPASQRGDTAVPGVWVAGDLRPITQQVAVALGTGNLAAVHIDQTLLTPGD